MPPVSYNVGDKVEVCGNEEGLMGSYWEAKVVSVLADGRYEVKYKNLIEDEETNVPLKEVVLGKDLRPLPPRVKTCGVYQQYQMVDAFENDGWWYGRINDRVACFGGTRGYYVYFSTTNELLPFHCSRIRVHHDFIDGEWVRA